MAGDLQGDVGTKGARCDFCEERHAFLYCKADSARLCLACDHHVHSANPLSLKHARAPLCERCRKRAATLQCEEEMRFLCATCEQEQGAHDGEGHTVGKAISFNGCVSPRQIASAWKCHAVVSPFLDAFVPSMSAELDRACWASDGSLSSIVSSCWTTGLDSFLLSEPNSCFTIRAPPDQYLGGQNASKQVLFEQLEQLQRLQTEGDGFVADLQLECFQDCMAPSPRQLTVPYSDICGLAYPDPQQPQVVMDEHKFSHITSHPQQRSQYANKGSWNFPATRQILDTKVMTGYDSCELSNESHRLLPPHKKNELSRTVPLISMVIGTENGNCMSEEFFSAPQSYMHKTDRSNIGISQNPVYGTSVPVCANSSKLLCKKDSETLSLNEDVPTPCVQVSELQVQHQQTSGRSLGFINSGVPLADVVGAPPSLDTETSAQARDCAMTRYKEKKKARNFEKFVRYESRKARAETRLRVRGRFVKANSLSHKSLLTDGLA